MSHLDGDVYCTLHFNLNQPLNQLKFINASYDTYCEKYLLKPKFMKLSNFAWFIDLFMTSFNQRYPLRYHISTFNRYCLIIQIINQIPFIYFAIYTRFSVNTVNPYGGQYIVLSFIGMHLFNHLVKALLLANSWYCIFVHI